MDGLTRFATGARTAAVLSLGLCAPAYADGPALAFITLEGRTLTLTAQNAPFQPPMIEAEGARLDLHFADMRLGFPLPPHLRMALEEAETGWQVVAFHLETFEASYMNNAAQISEISGEGMDDLRLTIIDETLAPAQPFGMALVPIMIEITLRSP